MAALSRGRIGFANAKLAGQAPQSGPRRAAQAGARRPARSISAALLRASCSLPAPAQAPEFGDGRAKSAKSRQAMTSAASTRHSVAARNGSNARVRRFGWPRGRNGKSSTTGMCQLAHRGFDEREGELRAVTSPRP